MPGLFGILLKRAAATGPDLLAMARRMADAMGHAPWLRTEIVSTDDFCGGRVLLSVLDGNHRPPVAVGDPIQVWFDGEWFLSTAAEQGETPSTGEIEVLLRQPDELLNVVDGSFNLACYDQGAHELLLANDRLGLRPLYWAETPSWFAYAGEVKALLALCDKIPDLDEISLRQFFGLDYLMGERTWWKGIERFPPGSVWRVASDRRQGRRYWSFDHISSSGKRTEDVIAELGPLWKREVRRHSRPGVTPLLLSGGFDSRLLLAELLAQGREVVAITFGSAECFDVRVARRVARAAGIRHIVRPMTVQNWWHRRDEAIWLTDGLVNAYHLQWVSAADDLRTGNLYSPLHIAGDTLYGGVHVDRAVARGWPHTLEALLAERVSDNPFFSRDEVIAASLADARGLAEGPSPDCFDMHQRIRRGTASALACLAPHCMLGYPGLGLETLRLLLGDLDQARRVYRRFYNAFLVAHYEPYFANLPSQSTGRGLAETRPVRLWRGLGRRLQRLGGIRRRRIDPDRWFVDYPRCLRESRVRSRLLEHDLLVDTFLGGQVRRVLQNDGVALTPRVLLGILTAETYFRQVADLPRPGAPAASSVHLLAPT